MPYSDLGPFLNPKGPEIKIIYHQEKNILMTQKLIFFTLTPIYSTKKIKEVSYIENLHYLVEIFFQVYQKIILLL